jgi:hypothetical protein
MTHDMSKELPPVLDVTTTAGLLDIGRSLAYELIRTGAWPTPVLHVGRLIKIPTAPLLRLLDEGANGHEHAPLPLSTARTYETLTRP